MMSFTRMLLLAASYCFLLSLWIAFSTISGVELLVPSPSAEKNSKSQHVNITSQLSNLLNLTTGETEFARVEFFIQAQSNVSTVAV